MTRAEKNDTTRQRLLEVGITLFSRCGYHGTGIKEIVDLAEVPKGSFYNYFKSKEDFGIEIILYHFEDFWQKWHQSLDNKASDSLHALENCFMTLLETHEDCSAKTFFIVALIAAEICETSETCRNIMSKIIDKMCSNLAVNIIKAQQDGYARIDIDAKDMAILFWDAWLGSIIRMKITKDLTPVRQCVTHFFGKLFKV